MSLTAPGKYTQFDDGPDSTHNLVLSLVPVGSRVLEFGCATGYMSEMLRARLKCVVTGIEVNEQAAEIAREYAQRVIIGDAETLDYNAALGSDQFEVVLFADILEHLRDPSAVLRKVRPFLAETGLVVASIPNVAHGSVRVALLGGDFRYTERGLLDDSHLRFFTRDSIIALFENAGYVITEWRYKRIPIDQTEVIPPDATLVESLKEPLESDPDATTYQFVVAAHKVGAEGPARAELGALRAEIDAKDASIRVLQSELAQHAGAATRAERLVDEQDKTIVDLRRSLDNRDELRRDLASLRKLLRHQSERIDTLSSNITASALRQDQLSQALEAVRNDLLQRDDSLHATLYQLQAAQRSDGQSEYQHIIRRVQELVRTSVPRDATVVVVSRGDDALLNLYGRRAWHFPQTAEGTWAGEYPSTSVAAIAQLEYLRALGAGFLIIPKPALWWLEHYAAFARHLAHRYRLVSREDDTAAVYDVLKPITSDQSGGGIWQNLEQIISLCRARLGHYPAILDWQADRNLADAFPLLTVFSPPSSEANTLPYIDASIEVVVLSSRDPSLEREARRVASLAVLTLSPGNEPQVTWMDNAPETSQPTASVSIVIPCYNAVNVTLACLRALDETVPRNVPLETIVVDDASTDDTSQVLQAWAKAGEHRSVLRNSDNRGFIASCNRGAQAATGDLLVFLNNDTLPLPGWLEALLQVFDDRPNAGVVGAKLLYPDGRLQEAGGVVFADGSAANVGRGEYDADQPPFNFVREVDYCSGAVLATPRTLFQLIGGFDPLYAPAYYEDTDYCFAVRAFGQRVYYQPACVVVHREGVSSGTDLSSGAKRFQAINQSKFAAKWADTLVNQSAPPGYYDMAVWHRLTGHRRVLADA